MLLPVSITNHRFSVMEKNMVGTIRERTSSSKSEVTQFLSSLSPCLSVPGFDLILQSDKWKRTEDSQEVAINMQQHFSAFSFYLHS